jgi:MFS family permease
MSDDGNPKEKPKNIALVTISIPEFKSFIIGRFCLIMALRMTATTIAWIIWKLTNNTLYIGMVGLAEVIPALLFALPAGHIIDKSEKKGLALRTLSFYVLCALALMWLTSSSVLHHMGNRFVTFGIYMVIFGTGILRAFANPTMNAMISQIVPRELLGNAVNWSQTTFLTSSIMVLLGILFVFQLKPKPSSMKEAAKQRTWKSVGEGLAFVYKTKEVLAAMSLDMFAVLFGGAVAMISVYATDILKVSPVGYGWLNAASDIGSGIMIATMTFFPLKGKQGQILLYAVTGFGICIILFGLSKVFLLSFIALLISGMLDGISVLVRGTIIQLKTPEDMKGRVLSVGSMFINSSNELGQFESGLAAKIMGVVPSVVFGGCMTLLTVGVTWFKAPKLRKMEY